MYDVIIVGAGPTGAALSYFLSSMGFKALIIEKDPRPGLRTICGEYLPDPSSLGLEDGISSHYLDFFRPFILHKMDRVIMEIGERMFGTYYRGYSIDRGEMIRRRLEDSLSQGAILRTGEAFLTAHTRGSGEVREVITSKGRYLTRYLIGADGFGSRVARLINGETRIACDDLALAFSLEISLELNNPRTMRLVISDSLAPGTYAWIIPRSENSANVGVGVRLSRVDGFDPMKSLSEFLSGLNARTGVIRLRGRYVPVGGMTDRVSQEGIFLAGDAAGMTVPSNGGGMHTGIMAAYLLATSLSRDRPDEYEREVNALIRPMVETGLVHRRAADFLMRTGLLWRTLRFLPDSLVEEVIKVERGPNYPVLRVLSLLYGIVRGRVGNYPACRSERRIHRTPGRGRTRR